MQTLNAAILEQTSYHVRQHFVSIVAKGSDSTKSLYHEIRKVDNKINSETHEWLCMGITTSIAEVPEIADFYNSLDEEVREHFIHRILWDQIKHFDKLLDIRTTIRIPVSDNSTFTPPSHEFVRIVDALEVSNDTRWGGVENFLAQPCALYIYRLILGEETVIAVAKKWIATRAVGGNRMFYRIAEEWDVLSKYPLAWAINLAKS